MRGALFASPAFIQFHPTALPVNSEWQSKTILMSESLRNDGRIWVPKRAGDERNPNDIPENERDYYLERMYPAYGNLSPRDVSSRAARTQIEAGRGVGPLKNSVYLDFRDALGRLGRDKIAERYGNLFSMYHDATGEDPYRVPMRIAPGAHFSMGGLWSDFDQMTSIPGLFVAARRAGPTTAPTGLAPTRCCRRASTAGSRCRIRFRTTWPACWAPRRWPPAIPRWVARWPTWRSGSTTLLSIGGSARARPVPPATR